MKDYNNTSNMLKYTLISHLYPNYKSDIINGCCPICHKTININEFRDYISIKEYHISGLCQGCQDEVFH